jgi:hypothetical protein
MKRKINNKLKMYQSVIEVCRDHQSLWENIPGFVSNLEEFENRVAILRQRSGIQKNITSGVSAGKRDNLERLFDHLLIVQGALWVYGNTINDFQLMERNKVTISELRRLNITELDLHLSTVLKDLEDHAPSLVAFGITPEYATETMGMINAGSNHATRPRMAIIERKMMTQSLSTITHELDILLKFRLDKLMLLFRVLNADFYNRYTSARVIVDHRGPTAGADPDISS